MTAQNLESNVTDCVARVLPWLVCHTRTALLLVDSQQRHFLSDIFMQKQIVFFYLSKTVAIIDDVKFKCTIYYL